MPVTDLVIPADHPALAGHFPGHPVVPGVVLLDEALHAIAGHAGLPVADLSLAVVKFQRLVAPGERLTLEFAPGSAGDVRFVLRCDDEPVMTGSIAARREGGDRAP